MTSSRRVKKGTSKDVCPVCSRRSRNNHKAAPAPVGNGSESRTVKGELTAIRAGGPAVYPYYLLRAAPLSQGRFFHLSGMNHLSSPAPQPVGAPEENISKTLEQLFISVLFPGYSCLFLFHISAGDRISEDEEISYKINIITYSKKKNSVVS